MFYSHQLLARKAPLGQIWMAATMHAKINRRKLDQIDIIKICEEILNPSVPMALRLSGILMGGVVIVYERKVKLLYDDVTRFMLQLNEAWKVKPAQDPTLLPKGKTQAKFEAVTLPEIGDTGLGDMEESVDFSNKIPAMGFEQTAYFAMRLNNVHEVNEKIMEEELNQQQHQADAANITLFDTFDPYQANSGPYNHFERFDIEGDEETHMNFPSQEHTDILTPPALSPQQHSQRGPSVVDDILYPHVEHPVNQPSDECRETIQQPQPQSREEVQKQVKTKRKAKRPLPFIMDDELTIIPGYLYQSWLQSSADLLSRRGKNRKYGTRPSTIKIANLMDVPPAALACGLIESSTWQVHYPRPILELWMRSIQPPQDTPSGGTTPPHPPEPSSSSPLANGHYRGEFHNGPGSESLSSIEKQMRAPAEGPVHVPDMELMSTGHGVNEPNLMATPTSFENHVSSASFLNSGTGPVFSSNDADGNSTRSSKKRPFSSSRNGGGLETVDEEIQWTHQEIDEPIFTLIEEQPEPRSKQARWSKHGPTTPDYELLVETGPTQTQAPLINDELENMTRSIKTHLKTYFETPGAPQTESLNQLADGMNKRRAAQLFYQTCVLATRDFLRVQQTIAYGDIFISRGAKM